MIQTRTDFGKAGYGRQLRRRRVKPTAISLQFTPWMWSVLMSMKVPAARWLDLTSISTRSPAPRLRRCLAKLCCAGYRLHLIRPTKQTVGLIRRVSVDIRQFSTEIQAAIAATFLALTARSRTQYPGQKSDPACSGQPARAAACRACSSNGLEVNPSRRSIP